MPSILDRTLHGITVAIQLILQFGVNPAIQWIVRTFSLVVNNLWTFVAVILMLIFCYERNGVWYDDVPTIVREFSMAPFTFFGIDMLGMTLIMYFAIGIGLLYVVRVFGVYAGCLTQWMRDMGVAIITFVLVGSAHLHHNGSTEFVTPDCWVRRCDIIIVSGTCLVIVGWFGIQVVMAGGFW